ncbi:hypothetical protein OSB04_019463 [Centaurea solstitialis]|uniref:Reverse transcriptase domain-containing protein n=1 Tax=Centaurea solstitialis TaxID=347529 RepID=A0AA38WCF2_9ASTR|nr:hypothetical protein OSB04_019463 [Centaurea solstitialis]
MKALIKSWRSKVRADQSRELETINKQIAVIDLLAEERLIDDSLVRERAELKIKANDLMAMKVKDLKQKAKSKWLLEGDENTHFFHGLVNHRIKNSRINGLNVNGSWVTCPEKIKEVTFEFFKRKFEEDHPNRPFIRSTLFKKLTVDQRASLEVPFEEKEIKDAVWSCGNNKAPGPDGFTFEFIRKFWEVVGKDFCDAVKFFEVNSLINPNSNASFVTLVPKLNDPLSLADYRPINLIGCVTKVITKVLAERLKKVINSVISCNQTAFIKGRSILDGPLMVNELIGWASRNKKRMLLFKVDFAKAFDSLNWNFLDDVLLQMGFGDRWRAWMKGCFSTTKVSILVNGSPTKEFRMCKGVRQGDPLAPFLFILAAEGLNVAFLEAQRKKIFKGIQLDNERNEVSILQYADDAILMGEWDPSNAKNMIRVLRCFELCSGLKINMNKSSVMGVGVRKEEIDRMARFLNCKSDSIPFKYLGLPVGGGMKKASNWQPVVDKFNSRLSRWKARQLSSGGRLCLCKSVLGSLSTYFFSLYKAPKKVLKTLESIRRRFLWGGDEQNRKISWVNWDRTLSDKSKGGLGIGSLRALNLAMLGKWWWRECNEANAMWNTIVKFCNSPQSRNGGNKGVWYGIKNIDKELIEMGIDLRSFLLPKADGRGWMWSLDPSNNYTVSSLRKLIDNSILPDKDSETIWIRWIPSKVNFFLWRFLRNRLATKDNLEKRGVRIRTLDCHLCYSKEESLDHIMGDCSTSRLVSAHMARWVQWWPLNESSAHSMWTTLCNEVNDEGGRRIEVKKVIGAAYFWTMWCTRNDKVFNGVMVSDKVIFESIRFLAFDWIRNRTKFGKFLTWDLWSCNPSSVVNLCSYVKFATKGFKGNKTCNSIEEDTTSHGSSSKRVTKKSRGRFILCPEPSCVHHDPSRALGDLTGIKKHYSRKHGEKKYKCEKCSKKYAVQSDWKAHSKTCGTREYRCDCGTLFSRRDSFITHRAFCDALAQETARHPSTLGTIGSHLFGSHLSNSMNLGLSQVGSQISQLHDQNHQSSTTNMLTLGNANFEQVMLPSTQTTLFSQTHQHQMPNSSSPFFISDPNQGLNQVFDYEQQSQPHGLMANKPNIHGLMQLPDLHSNTTTKMSPNLFNLGKVLKCPPHMSATALLQKAAQMGSTTSNNNATTLLKSFGSSSMSEGKSQAMESEMESDNDQFQGLMNSLGSGAGGSSSSIFGGYNRNRNMSFGNMNHQNFSLSVGNTNRTTLDFLGVGYSQREQQQQQQQQKQAGHINIGSMDPKVDSTTHMLGGSSKIQEN